MGEVESLLLVLALLYLSECMVWVRRGALVFTCWWGCACQVRTPPGFAGNQRGGVLLTSLLPSRGTAFLAVPPLVSLAPNGLYGYSAGCLDPAGRRRQDGPYVAWEAIHEVRTEGRQVVLNGKTRLDCVSNGTAGQLTEAIREVRGQMPDARAGKIEQWLLASLDTDAVRARLTACRVLSRHLRWLAVLLFAYVFGFAPLVLFRHGFGALAAGLVAGVLVQTVVIAWLFRRAHQRLYPQAGEDRFKHFLIMLLAPPAAIRAPEILHWHLLDPFHPLAVARVVCDAPSFGAFARRVLVDLRWPLLPVCAAEEPGRRQTESWFRELHLRTIERFLCNQGIEPATLLAPPERVDAANQAFCRRCGAQFVRRESVCLDCGGRPCEPFVPEPKLRSQAEPEKAW